MKTITLAEWETSQKNETISELLEKYGAEISKSKSIGDFKNRNIFSRDQCLVNKGNNVGIIEFGTNQARCRLELRPKLKIDQKGNFWRFLPKMLDSLCNFEKFEDHLFLDPEKTIILPAGCNIVPLLTLSFVSLCDKVIRKGMLRKYINKREELTKIKGKIDFSMFVKGQSYNKNKIPCSYYDLTFNNHENQIVLWCAHKLLRETRKIATKNKGEISIIKKLREQYVLMQEEISLVPKNKLDVDSLNLSAISQNYIELMNVCKTILSESLFSFNENEHKESKGINFVIDMDWIFEQYMTNLFFEVVEDEDMVKLVLNSQLKQTLCDNNKIKIKPDLIISRNNKVIAVIDFKWKQSEQNNNADFYQIICYGLAELSKYEHEVDKINTYLFAVSDQKEQGLSVNNFDRISKVFSQKKEINIKKIALSSNMLNEDPEVIERNLKIEVKHFLKSL
jgi:5-methylcytosine-specific restriction enzyme subunit McrC